MKKIVFILLGLILLSSCGMTSTSEKGANTPSSNPNTPGGVSTTTYIQDIESTSSKIKDTDEFKGCMKQQAAMCIQSTGMQIAQKMKDTAFCKELSTPEQK